MSRGILAAKAREKRNRRNRKRPSCPYAWDGILYGSSEVRVVKRKCVLEEAKKTDRPPEVEVFVYNTKEDFDWASVGILESGMRHGRARELACDRAPGTGERRGVLLRRCEGRVGRGCAGRKDDVYVAPKDTVYDYRGRMRLFLVRTPPTSRTPTSISTACGIE